MVPRAVDIHVKEKTEVEVELYGIFYSMVLWQVQKVEEFWNVYGGYQYVMSWENIFLM